MFGDLQIAYEGFVLGAMVASLDVTETEIKM